MFFGIPSIWRINTIHPVDKSAVIEFAHDAAIDDFFQFDLSDARAAAEHQTLNSVAHSFDNGLIDLSVQIVQYVQAGYELNWFKSFQTFKTFQSFSISELSNRSRRSLM